MKALSLPFQHVSEYSIKGLPLNKICSSMGSSKMTTHSSLLESIELRQKKATTLIAHIKREDVKQMCDSNPHIKINPVSINIIESSLRNKRKIEFKMIQKALQAGNFKDILQLHLYNFLAPPGKRIKTELLKNHIADTKKAGSEIGVDNIVESTLFLHLPIENSTKKPDYAIDELCNNKIDKNLKDILQQDTQRINTATLIMMNLSQLSKMMALVVPNLNTVY